MTVNPLIFSNNPRYRITRHALFWLLWILYYSALTYMYWNGKYSFEKRVISSLVEVTISTPMDMIFCYSIIYYLLPKFLFKGRYIQMALLWILFSVLFIVTFRTYNYYVLPYIRGAFGMPTSPLSSNLPWVFLDLFYQINMEGCMAAAIKLGKMAFIKQQELDLIKREKLKLEPDLLRGKMQPVFLINALDRVEQLSISRPSLIPGMVKKIKNLLLYVIYDNNQTSVSLDKELLLVEEYVELEKTGMADNLRVILKITGNITGERIAPFIILPLVENGFRQLSLLDLQNKFIDLEIRVTDGSLQMKVGWSKPVDSSTLANGGNAALQNIGKRLDLLYPQSHELKVTITTNQFIIDLRIDLHRAIN
ncbi:MAG TPA: histidine kinase [Puia sp.]|nr:histidine kinase [Puia sp.]